MKNINNCAELSQISFKYKDYGMAFGISDSGYVGCIEIESEEELKRLIDAFNELLEKGR